MSTHIRTRQSARNATFVAQAAAVVLVVGGAAMAFKGLPGLGASDGGAAAQPALPGEGDPQGAQAGGRPHQYAALHDPETVDDVLSLLKNHPVPDPVPDEVIEPPPLRPDDVPGVRYVGSIKVGGRAAAFMNVGGVTKLLRPGGRAYEGVQLLRVEEDSVVVSIDDAPAQSIERTARSGSAVSLVVGGAPAGVKEPQTALGDDRPEAPNFTPDMSREERRAALLERARNERSRWERQRGDDGGPPN